MNSLVLSIGSASSITVIALKDRGLTILLKYETTTASTIYVPAECAIFVSDFLCEQTPVCLKCSLKSADLLRQKIYSGP
uniref:Secreted protein n=1 Tax=Ascaris lumbricoides TaxID=6252 RepID=A0A0M3HN27_ASCLU